MKDFFINRTKEQNIIRDLLRDVDKKTKVAIILAGGGLGKTRFLQKIEEIVQGEFDPNDYEVLFRFDFDEGIPKDAPRDYFIHRLHLHGVISESDMSRIVDEGVEASVGKIISDRNTKRKVFLFDTMEKLNDKRFIKSLFKILNNLSNSVIIFAGRGPNENEKKEVDDFADFVDLVWRLDPEFRTPMKLELFRKKDAIDYINTKEDKRGAFILQKIVKQLAELSNGIPIIIDLAADYVTNDVSFQDLLEITPVEFEGKLVERVTKLKNPLDLLILLLAEISPLSEGAVARIFDTTIDKAKEIVSYAKTLSFIKVLPNDEIRLHDKMEDLIKNSILEKGLSPIESRDRKIYFRNARDFFREKDQYLGEIIRPLEDNTKKLEGEIKKLENEIQQDGKSESKSQKLATLKSQNLNFKYQVVGLKRDRQNATLKWAQYSFIVDPNAADWWELWYGTTRSIREGRRYEFVRQMLSLVTSLDDTNYEHYLKSVAPFTMLIDKPDEHYRFNFLWAQNQRDLLKLDDGERRFRELLKRYGDDEHKRSNILNRNYSRDSREWERRFSKQGLKGLKSIQAMNSSSINDGSKRSVSICAPWRTKSASDFAVDNRRSKRPLTDIVGWRNIVAV